MVPRGLLMSDYPKVLSYLGFLIAPIGNPKELCNIDIRGQGILFPTR